MSDKTLDPSILAQFTGSETFYRHWANPDVLFTEGVHYVAETAGAYWLVDEIALAQRYEAAVQSEEFQVWDLIVPAAESAQLTCGDGNGREVHAKRIEWTDFPAPGMRFYFCNGCIHLPSEY